MSILIFSRPVRTGKTTELLNWYSGKKNIAGVAMPDVDGRRKILDLRTQELIDAEVSSQLATRSSQFTTQNSPPIIEIGKYKFYRSAFEWANQRLLTAWALNPEWLVIDELGKLELKGEGFFPVAQKIVEEHSGQPDTNILVTVREGLVNEITSFFALSDWRVVSGLDEIF